MDAALKKEIQSLVKQEIHKALDNVDDVSVQSLKKDNIEIKYKLHALELNSKWHTALLLAICVGIFIQFVFGR